MCVIHRKKRKYDMWHSITYSEKGPSGSTAIGAVLDLGLLGQIFRRVHRGRHLWRRQEGWNKSSSPLSSSTNLPSLRCRRRPWWGWRTTTCLPPSGWKSPCSSSWSSWSNGKDCRGKHILCECFHQNIELGTCYSEQDIGCYHGHPDSRMRDITRTWSHLKYNRSLINRLVSLWN